MSWLSCLGSPVKAVLFYLSRCCCPVLAVLFCLSCSACPVLGVLSRLSCPGRIQTHEHKITSAKIKKRECTSAKNRGARKIEKGEKSRSAGARKRERKSAKFKAKKERENTSAKPKKKRVPSSADYSIMKRLKGRKGMDIGHC
jgi:hypothetical protein